MPETKEEASVLKALLEKTKLIRMKYEKLEEIQATHFNVFSILHEEHDEVRLHSRFIYELLNPNAEHKQKDVFLKAFLACSGNERLTGFMTDEISQAGVKRERHNIDILISTPNKAIIIENKIGADYRDQQLSGYRDKIEQQGYSKENIRLVYLTLDGSEVGEGQESEEVRKEMIAVSYKEHITAWLKTCISEVALIPTMRETIQQYLQLVQKLTGQSHHKEETMEIKELFLQDNGETMRAFQNAQGAFGEAKVTLEQGFWDELKERLKKDNYKVRGEVNCNWGNWQSYYIFICEIDSPHKHIMRFEIQRESSGNKSKFTYGFLLNSLEEKLSQSADTKKPSAKADTQLEEKLREYLGKRLPPTEYSKIWMWIYHYTEENKLNLKDFTNDTVLALYFDENKRKAFIEDLLQEIKGYIKLLRESSEFKEYRWLI